ncbi:MAG: L-rhamnose mutarotase [Bacteroidota bacterium]
MSKTRRYCFACDLKDEPALIEAYERYHSKEAHWPDIAESIKATGITNMEIYRMGNRLFMIMEVNEAFDFDQKAKMDAENPRVQEWEELMNTYQQAPPWAAPGEKWVPMKEIFKLY